MRILWIGKQPGDGAAGDEVFDRKTIAACRALGHEIDLFHPAPVGRMAEIANLLSGVPHYRARFAATSNRDGIQRRAAAYDGVIFSWEPLDVLARRFVPPGILILHNVTSRALPALFPGNLVAAAGAARARAWERRWYRRGNFSTIATLSRRDLAYVRSLPDAADSLLLPPGMPPCSALAEDAVLIPELVVSGTFDWVPKRRDILRFAREYRALDQRPPVRAGTLPAEASRLLAPLPLPTEAESASAIRFGLITDRFEAGHKLKTMAYIAANQIVLSFADVAFDFDHIPDHAFFIRRIASVAEIAPQVSEVAAIPAATLRARFSEFQRRCAQCFTWTGIADRLMQAAAAATPDLAKVA